MQQFYLKKTHQHLKIQNMKRNVFIIHLPRHIKIEPASFRRVDTEIVFFFYLKNQEGLLQSTTIELAATSNDSYIYQGYYQCVVFAPRFMKEEVRSSKLQVQFEGKF